MKFEEFTAIFTDKKISYIKLGKKYYEENNQLKSIRETIKKDPESTGIILGEDKKDFRPSIYLLEKLSKMTLNKVFINEKAEWLFLCGRDVFEKNITKNNSTNKLFLVQNKKDENLGLGMISRKKDETILKNILDRGDFLRRER